MEPCRFAFLHRGLFSSKSAVRRQHTNFCSLSASNMQGPTKHWPGEICMKSPCLPHITRRDATKLLGAALLSRSVPLPFAHAQASSQQSNAGENWPTEADIDF